MTTSEAYRLASVSHKTLGRQQYCGVRIANNDTIPHEMAGICCACTLQTQCIVLFDLHRDIRPYSENAMKLRMQSMAIRSCQIAFSRGKQPS